MSVLTWCHLCHAPLPRPLPRRVPALSHDPRGKDSPCFAHPAVLSGRPHAPPVGEGCHWLPACFFSAEDCSSVKTYSAFVLLILAFPSEAKGDPRPPQPCPWPGAAAPPAGREMAPGALPAALRERRERPGRPDSPHPPRGHGLRGQLPSKQAGEFSGSIQR